MAAQNKDEGEAIRFGDECRHRDVISYRETVRPYDAIGCSYRSL
ncbi:MAG TPA: hypothetical protein VIL31_02585 [Cyclobacteriaceae bacterium]